MGFFSRRSIDASEKRLLEAYTAEFRATGFTEAEARDAASAMLSQAKADLAKRGPTNEPHNAGDWLLQQERTDPQVSNVLECLREEGVTNADILWWWNQPPLERAMLQKMDEFNRTAAFIAFRESGYDAAQAAERMWKSHPRFGKPTDGEGDDRPLPIELKARIVAFIESYYARPDEMKKLVDASSSFNAIVRAAIRRGAL